MKGAHFPPTFPHPRFLERKRGKELCAKLRFASGDAALRGGRGGCSFLLAQKGTKKAPGSVAPTNISPKASVHSRHPWTPFTKAGHFGREVSSGGQNQDLFPFYSRALGPFSIKICKLLPSIVHRLMPAYLFGAAVVGLPPATAQPPWLCQTRRCPYSADTSKFLTRQGPVPPRQEGPNGLVLVRRAVIINPPGGRPPVAGGLGAKTVSASSGSALTGSSPRRFFGSFLIAQKGTSPLPAPQSGTLSIHKKETHNAERR